jgi:hypothetical protein
MMASASPRVWHYILELSDPGFVHGPLEAVFTIDEESTMAGAEYIGKAPFLQSTVMINVDSEEASSICVGCAGGFEKKLSLPVKREPVAAGKVGLSLHLPRRHTVALTYMRMRSSPASRACMPGARVVSGKGRPVDVDWLDLIKTVDRTFTYEWS